MLLLLLHSGLASRESAIPRSGTACALVKDNQRQFMIIATNHPVERVGPFRQPFAFSLRLRTSGE